MISPFSRCKMPCQYYSAIRNDIIFIVLPPSYQGSARDAMQTKYIYFNTMIIACCYFYCIAITTLLIVLHCHYPLAVVIAIEHHIFVHRHVRAFLLMTATNCHQVLSTGKLGANRSTVTAVFTWNTVIFFGTRIFEEYPLSVTDHRASLTTVAIKAANTTGILVI